MDEEAKMSEKKISRKNEGKKKRALQIAAGILHWGWVILLAVLLVASVVLSAPWKVILLVAILLLSATALPRGKRKWFWAGVGGVVLVLVIWVLLPTDYEGWEPYKYDFSVELARMKARRAVPEAENAAIKYRSLLESDDVNDTSVLYDDPNVFGAVYKSAWMGAEYPSVAQWVEKHRYTIEALMRLSRMEKCRFALTDPQDEDYDTARYGTIWRWGYLLVIAGNKDWGEGRMVEAIEKQAAVLRIGGHLHQQGMSTDVLVATALKALAVWQMRMVVMAGAGEEELGRIETEIINAETDWEKIWRDMGDYEKLMGASELRKHYEIDKRGRIRLSRDPQRQWRMQARERLEASARDEKEGKEEEYEDEVHSEADARINAVWRRFAYPSWWVRKFIKATTIVRWLYLPREPEKALRLFHEGFEECVDTSDEAVRKWREGRGVWRNWVDRRRAVVAMAGASERFYYLMREFHLRLASDRAGTLLIVGLRRYKTEEGRWPESLEDISALVDPEILTDAFTESAFVYELTEDGFRLYSKGKNGIDDGGKREKNVGTYYDPNLIDEGCDDWMIWPRGKKGGKEGADGK